MYVSMYLYYTYTSVPTGYVKALFIVLRGIRIRSHDHCDESDLRVHSTTLNRIGTKIPFFPFVAIGVRKTGTTTISGGGNGRLKCKGY